MANDWDDDQSAQRRSDGSGARRGSGCGLTLTALALLVGTLLRRR